MLLEVVEERTLRGAPVGAVVNFVNIHLLISMQPLLSVVKVICPVVLVEPSNVAVTETM